MLFVKSKQSVRPCNVDGLLTLLVDGAHIINIATRGFEGMLVSMLSRCQPVYNILVRSGYSKLGEDEAEPEVVVAVAGRVVVTVRRAAVSGVVVPAATAFYAVRPTRG